MKTENFTKIIERLSYYLEYKGTNFNQLAIGIDVSNSYFSKMIKSKGSLGEDIINKILLFYDDLSVEWFVTGGGEMLKNCNASPGMDDKELLVYKTLLKDTQKEIADLNQKIGVLTERLLGFQSDKSGNVSAVPNITIPKLSENDENPAIILPANDENSDTKQKRK